MQRTARGLQLVVIALAVILLAIPARLALYRTRLPDGYVAPAAVVLGAGFRGDGPSPVFAARLDYGLELLRTKRAGRLILTGGVREGVTRSEADVGRSYLLQRGADASALLMEQRSHNTLENLCYAAQIAREHALTPLIVISDAAHLPRALLLAEDIGLPLVPGATPYSRLKRGFAALSFLLKESALYSYRLFTRPAQCPAPHTAQTGANP